MDALLASYGDNSSDSPPPQAAETPPKPSLPPPASLLLDQQSSTRIAQPTQRIRTFPHTTGNYALHVYIPITLKLPQQRRSIIQFLIKLESLLPNTLHTIGLDIPLSTLADDHHKIEDIASKREFHVSLGRTVPIRVHQIGSVVGMLRQKVRESKPFWIDFSNWDVFVNDDRTRSFLSLEVVDNGLGEIVRMVKAVDEVYRLHSLPEFYANPRPHISVAWAFGDVSEGLRRVVFNEVKRLSGGRSTGKLGFSVKFGGVVCKIGKKSYDICKIHG